MRESKINQHPFEIDDALRIIDTIIHSLGKKKQDIIRRISCQLMMHHNIDGVMIGGSLARNSGDIHSDLDLIVLLSDDEMEDFHISRMITYAKAQPMYCEHSVARSLPYFGELLTLFFFDLSFNIDIGFFGPKQLSNTVLENYGKIVLDRSGKLRSERDRVHPSPMSREYDEEIWINLWKVKKSVWRNNYWRASEYLSRARRSVVALMMREQGSTIYYPGREDDHIEQFIDVERFNSTWTREHPMGYEAASIALIDIANSLQLPPRIRNLLSVLRLDFVDMNAEIEE